MPRFGEGVWLIDDTGRSLLDAYNNVPSVGHCHPTVVQALARQAATLNTNTRYLYKSVIEYADRLTATMPGDLPANQRKRQPSICHQFIVKSL